MLERWVLGLDSTQGGLGLKFEFENGWSGLILQPHNHSVEQEYGDYYTFVENQLAICL